MFTKEEIAFLISAADEAVKRGGLNAAGMGLSVALKLQNLNNEPEKIEKDLPPVVKDPTPKDEARTNGK